MYIRLAKREVIKWFSDAGTDEAAASLNSMALSRLHVIGAFAEFANTPVNTRNRTFLLIVQQKHS